MSPGEPCCYGGEQSHGCEYCLHDSSSAIAGRKFGGCDFHAALHSRSIFDKVDVDGGSREQAARENSNEFGNLAHCSPA